MTHEEFSKRYKYDISTDRLGGGGFGEVYKAYDTFRDRWVAIKVSKVLPDLENVRLRKEVEMVNALPVHPNIAYYEDCYTFSSFDGEYDFGILQYYEEGNLLQLLKKDGLSLTQKQSLLAQILGGLKFLHDNGIIHRDLKPQNILIVKRGEEYIPKITDFGISKKLDTGKSAVFSNSLVGAGTLAYSSPEQLGDRTIRKNTDLWSFGVIAYYMLTGELPFTTGNHANTSEAGRQELFLQINRGALPAAIGQMQEPWQTLIRRCLVPDAGERIRTCAECVDLLAGKHQQDAAPDEETKIDLGKTAPAVEPKASPDEETKIEPDDRSVSGGKGTPPTDNNRLKIIAGAIVSIIVIAVIFWANYAPSDKTDQDDPADSLAVEQPSDSVTTFIVDSVYNNDDDSWFSAKSKNTKDAYKAYLHLYPKGKYATQAKQSLLRFIQLPNLTDCSLTLSSTSKLTARAIVDAGDGNISERGFCYSTKPAPTVNNTTIAAGKGVGDFSAAVIGLAEGNTYYFKAYAINEKGVAYGREMTYKVPVSETIDETHIAQAVIEDGNKIYDTSSIQVMPEYPGGIRKFIEYIVMNLAGVQLETPGDVRMRFKFVIEKNGTLTDITTINDGDQPSLAAKAIRVLASSPKWQPGSINGKPVRVSYTVPIIIRTAE